MTRFVLTLLFGLVVSLVTLVSGGSGVAWADFWGLSDKEFAEAEVAKKKFADATDNLICHLAYDTDAGRWRTSKSYRLELLEAKRRGLNCMLSAAERAERKNRTAAIEDADYLCRRAAENGVWRSETGSSSYYVATAKRRGLTCGVGDATQIASSDAAQPNTSASIAMTTGSIEPWMSSTSKRFEDRIIRNWCAPPNETTLGGEPFLDPNSSTWNRCAVNNGPKPSPISYETVKRFYTKSENRKLLCRRVKKYKSYEETLSLLKFGTSKSALTYFILARDVELDCSKKEAVHSDVLSANAIEQLDSERQKRFKLEQQLAALKAQQEQQQTFSSDAKLPKITIASASSNGPQGTVKGRVTDNTGIAEVRVDGQLVQIDANGNFTASTYVPEGGVSVSIQAVDLAGLSSSMSVRLDRSVSNTATSISFERLNPLGRKVAKNKDALALIIGVDGYSKTPARAIYADSDAKVFADYASQKLGIPTNRIKTLVNDGADESGMLLAVKRWLARASKKDKSDVYVFFAGHGLASDDGQKMYLLPYDGAPELLEKTAILRQELFDDIASANPRSVTVFLDTCYSGTTRGTDMLMASRPIAIKALEQSIPDNFTVMTAAAGDQTAKPLEEAKHGMFSYFLMKGMEGEADANQDNKITAGELHQYVQQNVIQQSSGSQTPELQGDAERVLVRFQ